MAKKSASEKAAIAIAMIEKTLNSVNWMDAELRSNDISFAAEKIRRGIAELKDSLAIQRVLADVTKGREIFHNTQLQEIYDTYLDMPDDAVRALVRDHRLSGMKLAFIDGYMGYEPARIMTYKDNELYAAYKAGIDRRAIENQKD